MEREGKGVGTEMKEGGEPTPETDFDGKWDELRVELEIARARRKR